MSLYIARGNEIFFEVTFLDINRQPMAPTAAMLRISFLTGGARQTETINMTSEGEGVFTASWKSHVADPGPVEWHAYTSDHVAAQDGSFQLIANNANPNP
jgi:hypothetical protein